MTEYRCPKCESIWDSSKFGGSYGTGIIRLCETCRKNNSEFELERFGTVFNDYCTEIFCLRYPNEPHAFSAIIPSDYWEKKELIENKKEAIEKAIKNRKELEESCIKNIEISKEHDDYNEVSRMREVIKISTTDRSHLEAQQPKILQLEQRYKQ